MDAPVALYTLTIEGHFDTQQLFSISLSKQLVVLFNAWSPRDGVFVEDEDWRHEYVLQTNGRVYAGDKYVLLFFLVWATFNIVEFSDKKRTNGPTSLDLTC